MLSVWEGMGSGRGGGEGVGHESDEEGRDGSLMELIFYPRCVSLEKPKPKGCLCVFKICLPNN